MLSCSDILILISGNEDASNLITITDDEGCLPKVEIDRMVQEAEKYANEEWEGLHNPMYNFLLYFYVQNII